MTTINWKELMDLDISTFDENEEETENMYNILSELEINDDIEVTKLKKLFVVTQTLMVIKGTWAEITKQKLSEQAETEGANIARKEQEIANLKLELDAYKKKIKDLQKFGGSTGGEIDVSARTLREENDNLETQISQLNDEIRIKERKLKEKTEEADKNLLRAEDAEKKNKELKIDNDQLRDDLRDLQRTMDAQRENIISKRDVDKEYLEKIKGKNVLLNAALDENRNLTELNIHLEDEVEKLKREMTEGKIEMDKTTDEYLRLKEIVDGHDSMVDSLQKDNEILKRQVDDLLNQMKSKSEADDEIIMHVNKKVEEWKELLIVKDEKISALQIQIDRYREDLTAQNLDNNKNTISRLSKILKEKEKEVDELSKKLIEATTSLKENAILLDDVRKQLKNNMDLAEKGDGKKISEQLKVYQDQIKELTEKLYSTDSDAQMKDKALSDAIQKLNEYEKGIYGLTEAVTEIKLLKMKLNENDRLIEEMTQYLNRCEEQINDLYDEAEDLRERLGLNPKEPINIEGIRQRKSIKIERDRALNIVLQSEIERLEDERISLKNQIRDMTKSVGLKAASLGLTSEDLVLVNAYIEQLKADPSKKEPIKQQTRAKSANTEEFDAKKLNSLIEQNTEFRAKISELEQENQILEKGFKDLKIQISNLMPHKNGESNLKCEALNKMIEIFESRAIVGRYDQVVILKAHVDNLTGRNEELRRELKETKTELKLTFENYGRRTNTENIEMENGKSLKVLDLHLAFPEDSKHVDFDIVTSLNEHLILALHDLSIQKIQSQKLEDGLDNFRRKYQTIRHQLGLLYQDNQDMMKKHEYEKENLLLKINNLELNLQKDEIHVQEYNRLVEALSQDEPEVRRIIAEMSRKLIVMRVNEATLTRKYCILLDVESKLRKETDQLYKDLLFMEKSIVERIGYLQRTKDMAMFKMLSLQKRLELYVPQEELDNANSKLSKLSDKYQALLESTNSLVSLKDQTSNLQHEYDALKNSYSLLINELEIEKEKRIIMETAFEKLKQEGLADSKIMLNNDVLSLSRQLTVLSMKELHERERALHANSMYEQQKNHIRSLEDRNAELEHRFSQLAKLNAELEKTDRDLKEQLSNSISKSINDLDKKKILELEENELNLRQEISKLKDISTVALNQVKLIQVRQLNNEKEMSSLRQQLIDIQCESDEKTLIGKLHRHIVQLQISEGLAIRKLESVQIIVNQNEAQSLRLQQCVDENHIMQFHTTEQFHAKIRMLKKNIQDLRSKYSSAIPLIEQEKFTKLMIKLQNDHKQVQEDCKTAEENKQQLEDSIAEMTRGRHGLEELVAALKDGNGAKKILEWHERLETVRRENLKFKREGERYSQKIFFLEDMIRKQENDIIFLEEDKVRLIKEMEFKEMEWEKIENEYEKKIVKLQNLQNKITDAANKFEEAMGNLPDKSWPVSQQLDHAVQTIKSNIKQMLDAKTTIQQLNMKIEELEGQSRSKDGELLRRDRVINDLRLRLPTSSDRDAVIMKINVDEINKNNDNNVFESEGQIRAAQCALEDFQIRLIHKEETLSKYRNLLNEAQEDAKKQLQQHQQEMLQLQHQIQQLQDSKLVNFKMVIEQNSNKPGKVVATNEQIMRLAELEGIVTQQNNSMTSLREKLNKSIEEIQEYKFKMEDISKRYADEKENMKKDSAAELRRLQIQNIELGKQSKINKQHLEMLEAELEREKEKQQSAPSENMQKLVEALKNDLSVKENKLKNLTKTIQNLEAEIQTQNEMEVKSSAQVASTEINIQKLLDSRTKELQEQLTTIETENCRLRLEQKKWKEKERELTEDLNLSNDNSSQINSQLKKFKKELEELKDENDELKNKVQRMGLIQIQKSETEGFYRELEELRRINRIITDENQKLKNQPEKPIEPTTEILARWEEGKILQKKIETLKGQLKDKDTEIKKVIKSNELMKNLIEKFNREKVHTTPRREIKSAKETREVSKEISLDVMNEIKDDIEGKFIHEIQELKMKNGNLEDQISELKSRLAQTNVGMSASQIEELKSINKILLEKVQKFESENLGKHPNKTESQEYQNLVKREVDLQKQVLKLTEANVELNFEIERANKDIPRLKERNEDLQRYIDVLKAEKQHMVVMSKSRDSLSSIHTSQSSGIRKIGESGRSVPELERTIAILKKVVDKTRRENEQLKNNNEQMSSDQVSVLRKENAELKKQIEDLRLIQLPDSSKQNSKLLNNNYERVRKELVKEMEISQNFKRDKEELEMQIQKLKNELSNFGPDFFEEIEELKINFQAAVAKLKQYEEEYGSL